MPIILTHGLTTPEIRVLQEYRRQKVESLTLDAIKAIKHPAGGGEPPAVSLVAKGFLEADASSERFGLTPKGKDFLTLDPVPLGEEAGSTLAPAVENESDHEH